MKTITTYIALAALLCAGLLASGCSTMVADQDQRYAKPKGSPGADYYYSTKKKSE